RFRPRAASRREFLIDIHAIPAFLRPNQDPRHNILYAAGGPCRSLSCRPKSISLESLFARLLVQVFPMSDDKAERRESKVRPGRFDAKDGRSDLARARPRPAWHWGYDCLCSTKPDLSCR